LAKIQPMRDSILSLDRKWKWWNNWLCV